MSKRNTGKEMTRILPLSTTSAATRGVRRNLRELLLFPLFLPPLTRLPLGNDQHDHLPGHAPADRSVLERRELRGTPPVLHLFQQTLLLCGHFLLQHPQLLCLLLFLPVQQRAGCKEGECRGVHTFTRRACQHWRGKRRHTSARTRRGPRPSLRPGDLCKRCRPHPRRKSQEPSVPVGRRTLRAPPPLSAPPPAARCGGGPSPAPWQPSYGRDGAMPGAGDPAASWRLPQRVRHATACRPLKAQQKFTNVRATCLSLVWWLWWLWCGQYVTRRCLSICAHECN